jgi:hypothetical protein
MADYQSTCLSRDAPYNPCGVGLLWIPLRDNLPQTDCHHLLLRTITEYQPFGRSIVSVPLAFVAFLGRPVWTDADLLFSCRAVENENVARVMGG